MELYNSEKVSRHELQMFYYALAALSQEALSLISVSSLCVCMGFHQDLEQEVKKGIEHPAIEINERVQVPEPGGYS